MTAQFHVNMTTPDKIIYDGHITSLVAPGSVGYLGILAHHRPIVTTLAPGKVILKDETGKAMEFHSTGNGFLEVSKNSATLLLDSVQSPS